MPNKKLIVIFNHQLTEAQKEDAYKSLGVSEIILLPDDLQKLWSQVPPEPARIDEYLGPVQLWLTRNAKAGDFVLIQGEFGATLIAVNKSFLLDLVPIYSTTSRIAEETMFSDGKVGINHIFSHVRFREYQK